ncbi:MAG: Eco57I restriction-modification methylase domain-containing protein, partial [Rectinemataceae bacterium]
MAALEDVAKPLSDAEIAQLLDLLCYATYRTRQGRGSIPVKAPVDFSDLSSEYIGILYEGLLDFELRRAEADDAVVFLNAGNQPALPLSRLEDMSDGDIETLFKELVKAAKKEAKGENTDEEVEDEDTEEDEENADGEESEEAADVTVEEAIEEEPQLEERSAEDLAADRIKGWKHRAAMAMERKKRKTESDADYHERIERASRTVSVRDVLPGEWYLVRWGGTRKGSGTFYTPPGLVEPTVRRTLEPLLYEVENGARRAKLPEAILSLKAADIAMGSGSFLIGALREITDALVESLYINGRITDREDGTVCRLADGGNAGIIDDMIPLHQSHDSFEDRLRGRLKRHVVERCLYGVDIDPLAVELARLALWVETMDYELPFTFLDHKLKVGNSIVGCRFSWLGHYPVNAWSREGPDKEHPWTKAYKEFMNGSVKPSICSWLEAEQGQILMFQEYNALRGKVHSEGMAAFAELHALPVWQAEERRRIFQEKIEGNASVKALKDQLDLWCALWFWPADKLGDAPLAGSLARPGPVALEIARTLAREERFFHWELEFPDVFIGMIDGKASGFDAILGNPPWNILKPYSKEFFSNFDPLYRCYGKSQALAKQKEYFAIDAARKIEWDQYRANSKAMLNWTVLIHNPFGDPKSSDSGSIVLKRGS